MINESDHNCCKDNREDKECIYEEDSTSMGNNSISSFCSHNDNISSSNVQLNTDGTGTAVISYEINTKMQCSHCCMCNCHPKEEKGCSIGCKHCCGCLCHNPRWSYPQYPQPSHPITWLDTTLTPDDISISKYYTCI